MRALLYVTLLLVTISSNAEPRYTETEIGGPFDLPPDGVVGLNNNGDLVGSSFGSAFVYIHRSKTYYLIPHSVSGGGLNDYGKIGGTGTSGPAVWYLNGGTEDLGQAYGFVPGVSNNGQVIANVFTSDGYTAAEIWSWKPTLHAILVPPVPGFDISNAAYAINDLGHVVGESWTYSPSQGSIPNSRAYLYANGHLTDLGVFANADPGRSLGSSSARGVNNHDEVVGTSDTDFLSRNPNCPGCVVSHAFLWRHGKMTDLGNLAHDRGWGSSAESINDAGEIVGSSGVPGAPTSLAFVYIKRTMYNLTYMVDNRDPNVMLITGNKVNCHGWILALGYRINEPTTGRYYLLVPKKGEPERDECPRRE